MIILTGPRANGQFDPQRTTRDSLTLWAARSFPHNFGYRPSKFLYDTFKLLKLCLGKAWWAVASERVFRQAANGTTVMRLFVSLVALRKAWEKLDVTTEKRACFLKHLGHSLSLGFYTGLSFTGKLVLKIPAAGALLISDSLDLYGEYQEWQEREKLLERTSTALGQDKTYQMWKIAKGVASIGLGVFVLVEAFFIGATVGSAVILTMISIAVSALSMRADYYYDQKMAFHLPRRTGWPTVSSPTLGRGSGDERRLPADFVLPEAGGGPGSSPELSPQVPSRSLLRQRNRMS